MTTNNNNTDANKPKNHTDTNNKTKAMRIMQINTGNGYAKKSDAALLNICSQVNPKIVCISESNPQLLKPTIMARRAQVFARFNIEDKVWKSAHSSCVSIMIKKGIIYKRCLDLETTIMRP